MREPPLAGRTLAMLFQKPSLRTRVTFEAGMVQLGGHAIYLPTTSCWAPARASRDVARNLERFVDAIVVRTGPHEVVEELAAQADIPVINGLSLREHPCQALADMLHDRRSASGALAAASSRSSATATTSTTRWPCSAPPSGMEIRLAHPPATPRTSGSWPAREELAAASGGRLVFGSDPVEVGPRRRRRLHRRLDVDGPGGRGGGAA